MTSPVFIVLLFQQTVPRTSFHVSFVVEIVAAFQVVLCASPPQSQISCTTNEETPSPISRPMPKNAGASAPCAASESASTLILRETWTCINSVASADRAFSFPPALFSVTNARDCRVRDFGGRYANTHIGLFFHNPRYNLHPCNILLFFCCFCELCQSARKKKTPPQCSVFGDAESTFV